MRGGGSELVKNETRVVLVLVVIVVKGLYGEN